MAKLVLKDCVVTINSIDFSDHTSSVEINLTKDEIDTTNFGGGGRERAHGLKDDSFVVNLQQDFDPAEVDATLYPLWNNETEFPVTVKPRNQAVTASNPLFTGTCVLLEYQPVSGGVGELSETSVTFPSQRAGITRQTA